MSIIDKIYLNSPFFLKRLFANAEAIRRDKYRRFGNYAEIKKSVSLNAMLNTPYNEETVKKLDALFKSISETVPFYKEYKGISIESFSDMEKIPYLCKSDMRDNIDMLISFGSRKEEHFAGRTSGSTGTPLTYYNDKYAARYNTAVYDEIYERLGSSGRRIRISGVKIAPFSRKKPPFWYYIDKYKQLQMSAYHISEQTAPFYIDAMEKSGAEFATGYPSAYLYLAEYLLSCGRKTNFLKTIITDSEGLSDFEKEKIEKAFSCKVYRTYGLGETGICALECECGKYHLLGDVCYAENLGEEIVLTLLKAEKAPVFRYRTGDIGIISDKRCPCGNSSPHFESIEGRTDDYLIAKDGRKIGRLSHIMKPAVGVAESQIVQKEIGKAEIIVVPGASFDEESMKKVIEAASDYLGDMEITYRKADKIERTGNGKLKHVVRLIK